MSEQIEPNNINLLEYKYAQEDFVQIPGMALYELMLFAKAVAEAEERMGLCYSYPKKVKEIKDKDFLTAVEATWEEYPTASSFYSQQPQMYTSMLGAGANDLLLKIQNVHLQNIQNGTAKKLGTFETEEENVEIKLS